jgi:hypothetical protein
MYTMSEKINGDDVPIGRLPVEYLGSKSLAQVSKNWSFLTTGLSKYLDAVEQDNTIVVTNNSAK